MARRLSFIELLNIKTQKNQYMQWAEPFREDCHRTRPPFPGWPRSINVDSVAILVAEQSGLKETGPILPCWKSQAQLGA